MKIRWCKRETRSNHIFAEYKLVLQVLIEDEWVDVPTVEEISDININGVEMVMR